MRPVAPRSCSRSASARPGSSPSAPGSWPRWSRLRWPTRPRTTAGLAVDAIGLKWPNDLVVEQDDGDLRKLGGVLGETEGLGTADPLVIVGIGINTDWPADAFPPELAASMTSLREVAGVDVDASGLLPAFVERLGERFEALRDGWFDAAAWSGRQLTTGRTIRLERPDGMEIVRATGVDATTGALVVADPAATNGERHVVVGEITRVRVAPSVEARV